LHLFIAITNPRRRLRPKNSVDEAAGKHVDSAASRDDEAEEEQPSNEVELIDPALFQKNFSVDLIFSPVTQQFASIKRQHSITTDMIVGQPVSLPEGLNENIRHIFNFRNFCPLAGLLYLSRNHSLPADDMLIEVFSQQKIPKQFETCIHSNQDKSNAHFLASLTEYDFDSELDTDAIRLWYAFDMLGEHRWHPSVISISLQLCNNQVKLLIFCR
jgi:hypothetical protein